MIIVYNYSSLHVINVINPSSISQLVHCLRCEFIISTVNLLLILRIYYRFLMLAMTIVRIQYRIPSSKMTSNDVLMMSY